MYVVRLFRIILQMHTCTSNWNAQHSPATRELSVSVYDSNVPCKYSFSYHSDTSWRGYSVLFCAVLFHSFWMVFVFVPSINRRPSNSSIYYTSCCFSLSLSDCKTYVSIDYIIFFWLCCCVSVYTVTKLVSIFSYNNRTTFILLLLVSIVTREERQCWYDIYFLFCDSDDNNDECFWFIWFFSLIFQVSGSL